MWMDTLDVGIITAEYRPCQQGILMVSYDHDMNEGGFWIFPTKAEIIPTVDGLAKHPDWGWLAVAGDVVTAFRHRSAARKWLAQQA